MMNFQPVQCNDEVYQDYIQLFRTCFPGKDKFSGNYLDWLYRQNPDGQVVGFDAYDGNRLVAHYACIPAWANVGGQEVRILLSLNTATHPNYQGKGLFTTLAELTYAAGAEQGYDCVYGIANANSTPGFTRKLKFQLVGQLHARLGFGKGGVDFKSMGVAHQFSRLWSSQALDWRCANPANAIAVRRADDRTTFLAPALFGGMCLTCAELDGVSAARVETGLMSPLRLFIGMVPLAARRRTFSINIPNLLRPSPLNLIYRSLSGRINTINSDAVFITFLDFDAY